MTADEAGWLAYAEANGLACWRERVAGRLRSRRMAVFTVESITMEDPVTLTVFRCELGPKVPGDLIIRRRNSLGKLFGIFGIVRRFDDSPLGALIDAGALVPEGRPLVQRAREVVVEALQVYPKLLVQRNRLHLEREGCSVGLMREICADGMRYAEALEAAA